MFFRNIPDTWKMIIVEIKRPSRITSLSKIYPNIILLLKITYNLKDDTHIFLLKMDILQEPSWSMKDVLDSNDVIHQWFWPGQWICLTLYIQFDIFHSTVVSKLTKLDLFIPQEHFLIPFVDIKDVPFSCILKTYFVMCYWDPFQNCLKLVCSSILGTWTELP